LITSLVSGHGFSADVFLKCINWSVLAVDRRSCTSEQKITSSRSPFTWLHLSHC